MFPEYVKLEHVALRYAGCNEYWRHAGCWGIKVDDSLKVLAADNPKVLGKTLVPISKEEWAKDNEGYV